MYELKYKGHSITLCHYALRVWPKSHGALEGSGRSFDIGVDCNDFRPVSIDDVITRMNTLPNNRNYIYG